MGGRGGGEEGGEEGGGGQQQRCPRRPQVEVVEVEVEVVEVEVEKVRRWWCGRLSRLTHLRRVIITYDDSSRVTTTTPVYEIRQ